MTRNPLKIFGIKNKKIVIIATIGLAVILVATIVLIIYSQQPKSPGSPEYPTALPEGKSAEDLGGWKRVSPPGDDPVFAYTDSIDDITISVSQQPIPDGLDIAELARSYSATTTLDVKGTDVYIGTSAQGPQSVILSKNGLLILIKSQYKIPEDSWVEYIASLD